MKKNAGKYSLLALLSTVIIFMGFYRDFVFKSINALIKAYDYQLDYSMPNGLQFLNDWQPSALVRLKWVLTIVCSLIFMGLTIAVLRLLFPSRNKSKLVYVIYLTLTILSGLLMSIGFIFPALALKMYTLSRYLMGFLQSPLILMILIPAYKLSLTEKNSISN